MSEATAGTPASKTRKAKGLSPTKKAIQNEMIVALTILTTRVRGGDHLAKAQNVAAGLSRLAAIRTMAGFAAGDRLPDHAYNPDAVKDWPTNESGEPIKPTIGETIDTLVGSVSVKRGQLVRAIQNALNPK